MPSHVTPHVADAWNALLSSNSVHAAHGQTRTGFVATVDDVIKKLMGKMDPRMKQLLQDHPGYADGMRKKYHSQLISATKSKRSFDQLKQEVLKYNAQMGNPEHVMNLRRDARDLDAKLRMESASAPFVLVAPPVLPARRRNHRQCQLAAFL